MGLVIVLIVIVIVAVLLIWFVINRATTGEGGRHGGSTSEISDATPNGRAPNSSRNTTGHAPPVVGGEGEGKREL